ncbi:hypothetical protein MAM1_0002c00144 [Mucor ambiguus]|uniref:Uncharacterized protein n=1 Tax=Mucor ambiguus TaxID=91626 RepID=A0A0C9MCS5_9FUNG|nr:hypothetical protein MAM1_0002c00144 [Mucor ambiguus]
MLAVSVALLGATFTHKNLATAVVSLYTIASGAIAKLGMMRLNKFLLWLLVFLLTIWEAVCFILALVNRSKALTACEEANPSSSASAGSANNTTLSVGDYSTTFLGMEMGNTYGLANCAQAVQADVIGSAIILFVGQLLMFYAATVVGSYTAKLRERKLGHRLRDLEWDDNLDELASSYRADARNAPKYPMNDLNSKKKKGFFKFGSKK